MPAYFETSQPDAVYVGHSPLTSGSVGIRSM
jgi:hypothetical protein